MILALNRLRGRLLAVTGVLTGAGLIFAGCDVPQPKQTREEPNIEWQELPEEAPTEPAPLPKALSATEKTAVLDQIKASTSLIELHEATVITRGSATVPEEITVAVSKKKKALLPSAKTVVFGDSVDLLDVELRQSGSGESEILLLFLPKKKIPKQIKIGLVGHVDKSHVAHLSDAAEIENLRENWRFWPTPRAPEWVPGEEVLIRTAVNAAPVPYELKLGLYLSGSGRIGDYAELGWHAALDEK
jgi:hypothetical protein